MLRPRQLAIGVIAALSASLCLAAQCHESSTGASIGIGDDIVLPMQALGFGFPFGGATYTHVHPTTNGFVYLSNAGVPAPGTALCCSGTAALLVAGSPKICPFWSDLIMVSGTGSVKFNALAGKAVITWHNALEYSTTAPTFSIQLQLLSTGEILFGYDGRVVINTDGDYLIGMSQGNSATVPPPANFSTANATTTTTNYEVFNYSGLTFDLVGQTLQFIPAGVGYVWVASDCASAHTPYGTGCYSAYTSFHEYFPDATGFDLATSSMSMVLSGTSYLVLPGISAYVPPTGAATSLVLADDDEIAVTLGSAFPHAGGTTGTVVVCSNGFVSVASGNGTSFEPDVLEFLDAPHTAWRCWHDFNPASTGSGQVKFEEVGSISYLTWDGVHSFGTTNPETMQIQLDRSNGSVHFVWGAIGGFGNSFLVGYSPGGTSLNPGNRDLSATLPGTFQTYSADQLPLLLSALPPPPVSSSSASTTTYTTSRIPEFAPAAGVYVAIHILSLGQITPPGIDLGFLGAGGCPALIASLDLTQAMVGSSATQSVTFPWPAALPFGTTLYSQSIALFAPFSLPGGQNAFGMSTSNGIKSSIGVW